GRSRFGWRRTAVQALVLWHETAVRRLPRPSLGLGVGRVFQADPPPSSARAIARPAGPCEEPTAMHVPGAGHDSATSMPFGACAAGTAEIVQAGAGPAAAMTRNAALTPPHHFRAPGPRDRAYQTIARPFRASAPLPWQEGAGTGKACGVNERCTRRARPATAGSGSRWPCGWRRTART